jgi:hypothetical protein
MSADEPIPAVGPDTPEPSPDALQLGGRVTCISADVEILAGQLKVARGGSTTAAGGRADDSNVFEFRSDEPPFLGGQGRHPQPLLYVAAGVGF